MTQNNFDVALVALALEACKKIWNNTPEKISIEVTSKEFEGDYTLVTFELAKIFHSPPENIAHAIGAWLTEHDDSCVESFNVKGGFLNLVLKDNFWLKNFYETIVKLSQEKKPTGKTFVIEFSSPNTNKPLHLGHLRNNFLGQSTVRILQAVGHAVHSVCVVNDRGIHIAKSMVAYKNFANGETPGGCNMKGDKFVGKYYVFFDKIFKEQVASIEKSTGLAKDFAEQQAPIMLEAQESLRLWENGDTATLDLWREMNGWVYEGFEATYRKIGTSFDKIYYESETYLLGKEVVHDGLEEKIFYKKEDGSIWVDLTKEGLDEKLLIRRDGTSVYITQDLGMADLRYREFTFNKSIYIVGNEQDYHFEVLFKTLKHLDRDYADKLFHLSYGMVELPSGKMKSREGTVVDADDLIEEVENIAREQTKKLGKIDDFSSEEAEALYRALAMGALKFQILKVDPQKKILFNPEESIDFQGNTGPFIQYTHARICSILKKAEALGIKFSETEPDLGYELHPLEKDLLKQICNYDKPLSMAAEKLSPSVLAQYVFELSKSYNRLYAELSILQCEDLEKKIFRLRLSFFVKKLISECLYLLGIDAPEKM